MSKILEFEDIHRSYIKGIDVLRGINFSVAPGEVVGLIGKNGSGKTTLIRVAMGMIEAQRGFTRVFGLDPREHPVAVKRRIGYVSENQILPPFLKVKEVIGIHRELFPTWDRDLEQSLCQRFHLHLEEKIKRLSKGQARQVALLCAVSHKPDLLLLDEPAGGLDPAARREFLETSIQLLNQTGTTILFSSHYMTDVERLAGRIVMIHDGSVLIDSPLDDLQENYSVVLVPLGSNISRQELATLPECLGVRQCEDTLHAIFELDPPEAVATVEARAGAGQVIGRSVALEEMFVELMRGEES